MERSTIGAIAMQEIRADARVAPAMLIAMSRCVRLTLSRRRPYLRSQ
jgi:hypothetical protein